MKKLEHILLIPDGDRRYAKKTGAPLTEAYGKAAEVARNLVEWVLVDNNIPEFTFFALSYANVTKRDLNHLESIIDSQCDAINNVSNDSLFHKNGIRVEVHGERDILPQRIKKAIDKAEESTKNYGNHIFNILLGYSGALDLEHAVNKLKESSLPLTFDNIQKYSMIKRPIDFVVRTANEKRISDGPLLAVRYSEFAFIERFFPELDKECIDEIVIEYQKRRRTFGV